MVNVFKFGNTHLFWIQRCTQKHKCTNAQKCVFAILGLLSGAKTHFCAFAFLWIWVCSSQLFSQKHSTNLSLSTATTRRAYFCLSLELAKTEWKFPDEEHMITISSRNFFHSKDAYKLETLEMNLMSLRGAVIDILNTVISNYKELLVSEI